MPNKTAVIALGGNAITQPGVADTITNQFANSRRALRGIVGLAAEGYRLAITHGNGPQVGNALFRVEAAAGKAPILPLGVCVADTEGGMGYMIEQCLQNVMHEVGITREVATIVTQMMVDPNDPQISDPTKFVGQFYNEEKARQFSVDLGWVMKPDGDRGWRRVVASPMPLYAVGARIIKALVDRDVVVIAAGGGGIPVYYDHRGWIEGIDAVIDKDLASAVIAKDIGADILMILTGVEQVAIHFGKPDQKNLGSVNATELRRYYDDGHFPRGSMGPKIQAALKFLEEGGKEVIITSFDLAQPALRGQAGTRIVP